ncbi:MAG: Glu/Leu/Phe/Val dehydrogenase dimerization domain-containing protein [Alphaproteobacteria bacterium]|jgi:leucine dehydrogenase|nr:leucine dehydrogenase [Candidatus Jidaibacter sp.]
MGVFSHSSFDSHERIIFCHDPKTSLRAIIGIHNTNLGNALGGTRFWPYASETLALKDALRLSKGMSYKAAISGLQLGGGKAVIIGDPKKIKTPELMHSFAKKIEELKGRFITGEDVGTTIQDMVEMKKHTAHVRGAFENMDPSIMTSEGVFAGIKAALIFRNGSDSLKGIHVAIQGVGSVGRKVGKLLYDAGAKLTISDIYTSHIEESLKLFKADVVDANSIYDVDADIFAPCALGGIINDDTLPHLKFNIIAGSANNQLASRRHGRDLMKKGILYAPDYAINAGGLISVSSEGEHYNHEQVLSQVHNIKNILLDIFNEAKTSKLPTSVVSDHIAERRFLKSS